MWAPWRHRERRLVFLYSESAARLGSTLMRGWQLADIAREQGVRSRVSVAAVGARVSDADVFMTKGAAAHATPEQYEALKARGNRLLVDPLDGEVTDRMLQHADVIVAASRTAELAYLDEHPEHRVVRIDHHVDPRVQAQGPGPEDAPLRIGYFGSLLNIFSTPAIEERIDVHSVETGTDQSIPWWERPRQYPVHYAVRSWRPIDVHKPFLKGFTAAVAGAVILIGRHAEPEHWLGDDYPFFVSAEPTEAEVLAALDRLQEAHGGPEWRDARDRMEALRARVTDAVIARQLAAALDG